MQYFKIEVDKTVLSVADWASFTPPSNTKFPRAYPVADGAARVFFSPSFYMWLPKEQFSQLLVEEEIPAQIITSAPNPGISEGFILKALAIAQNPELAKDLV